MEATIPESVDAIVEKKSLARMLIINIVLFAAVSAALGGIWYQNKSESTAIIADSNGAVLGATTKDPEYLIELTDSLKANGFVLYGDKNESKTKKQLAEFGQAVDYLDYVECDPQIQGSNPQECIAKGIEVYPTWVHGTEKILGFLTLQEVEKMLATAALKE